jgi:DNA modification methylase
MGKEEEQGSASENQSGTSIFDPVLCEIVYKWFSAPGAAILDPFAGGSVRGIVAAMCGRRYVGVDLRREQIEANRDQAEQICTGVRPTWHIGDSRGVDQIAPGQYDLIFSCPPYADLEVYSDNPLDISTLDYAEFVKAYREIITKACLMLRNNRFACFVVGEVRGKSKNGAYYNFVSDTIHAFIDAGLEYYNEAILITSIGSLPIRVARQFESARKLGKTHQNVLVFVKGSAKEAVAWCGSVEISETTVEE